MFLVAVVEKVSSLGVVAKDDHLSDIDEEDFPSASEIVIAENVVTSLGELHAS